MTAPTAPSVAQSPANQSQRRAWQLVVPPLGGNATRLFLTSATILFVELVLIRWINANVVYIGFFSNFLLMASFLGIGVGILIGRGGRRVPILPFALLLLAVVILVYRAQLNVQVEFDRRALLRSGRESVG